MTKIQFRVSPEELSAIEAHPDFAGNANALVRLLAFRVLGLPEPAPERVAEARRKGLAKVREKRHKKI